jgi:hypothetical protein
VTMAARFRLAHRMIETGPVRGKLVLKIAEFSA